MFGDFVHSFLADIHLTDRTVNSMLMKASIRMPANEHVPTADIPYTLRHLHETRYATLNRSRPFTAGVQELQAWPAVDA